MAADDPAGGGARGAVPRHSRNPDAYRRGGVAGPMSPPAAVGEAHEIDGGEGKLHKYGIRVGAASGVGARAPADGVEAAGLAEAVLPSPVQRSATPAATAARNLAAYAETGAVKKDAFGFPVEVSGEGALAPAGMLEGTGMADAALASSCGHESPMPVRRSSAPFAMAEDHMACARAGSGKTAALGLPVSGLAAAAAGGGSAPFPLNRSFFNAGAARPPLRELSAQVHCFNSVSTTGGRAESCNGHENAGERKTTEKEFPGFGCLVPKPKSNPHWNLGRKFSNCTMPITRGIRCCGFLLGLLLMLSFVRTEANLSVDVCPVDQMKSTCPTPFQSKRPDQSLTKLNVEQRYIILPSVGKVERNEKNSNNQCPPESWQRTTLGIVGFVANLVMNLGPLINCCRIREVNTGRRWLLSLSSFSVFSAQFFWLIYFWLQFCWDLWKFTSSLVALIFNTAYMIFFWVMVTNKKCSDIICSLFLIIVIVALVLPVWKLELVTVAGVLGFVFTAFSHLFRMIASGRKWCPKASIVAVFGIVGSSMMFFKVNWSVEICYKIGSTISLVCRAIDLVVLLYYGCMQLFAQTVPGGLERDEDMQAAQAPMLPLPTPTDPIPPRAMDVPSPVVQSGTQPDGTLSASPSVTVPRPSGVVMHPSSPQGRSIRRRVVQQDPTGSTSSPTARAVVQQDTTGSATRLPHQEVGPARIPNSNVTMATDDLQQAVPGRLERDEDMQAAQAPLLPLPTPDPIGPILPAQGAMDVPFSAVQSGTQLDGTISALPFETEPRPSGVVMHPSSPQGRSIRRRVVQQDPTSSTSSPTARAVVQQDATGSATSQPRQEVDPARISNSNVAVATDDVQRGQN